MIEHFDGIGKQFDGSEFERIARSLLENQYGFDFISDKQLTSAIKKRIIVPACKYIPKATMDTLNKLADAGAEVVMTGRPLSFAGLKDKDKPIEISNKIIMSLNLEDRTLSGLKFIRRKMNGHRVYLIKNVDDDFDEQVPVTDNPVLLYDPMTGVIGKPEQHQDRVHLQLAKGQTIIIVESDKAAEDLRYIDPAAKPIPLNLEWELSFETGGPTIPAPLKTTTLKSWDDFDFSGTALYKTHFSLPEDPDNDGWFLDLGEVHESVRVVLNGDELATLIAPPFRVKIEPSMAQPENVLELHITNLAANRIAYMDRKGISWKKFYNINFPARKSENRKNGLFDASQWTPRPSGLLGPVQLLSIRK